MLTKFVAERMIQMTAFADMFVSTPQDRDEDKALSLFKQI